MDPLDSLAKNLHVVDDVIAGVAEEGSLGGLLAKALHVTISTPS